MKQPSLNQKERILDARGTFLHRSSQVGLASAITRELSTDPLRAIPLIQGHLKPRGPCRWAEVVGLGPRVR